MRMRGPSFGRGCWLLLGVSGLFALVNAISGMFTNVYLWNIMPDYRVISLFNLTYCGFSVLTAVAAGWCCKRFDCIVTLRLGAVFIALFHGVVLLAGIEAIHFIYGLGILLGMGAGCFWVAYNVLYFETIEPQNRDRANAISGFFGSLAGMMGPLLAGWVITQLPTLAGYRCIFASSLVLLIGIVVLTFFLHPRPVHGPYYLGQTMRVLLQPGHDWAQSCRAKWLHGVRDGIFVCLVGVFSYSVLHNEWQLGCFFTLASFLSMLTFMLSSRLITTQNRSRFLLVGALGMAAAALPLLKPLTPLLLIAFGSCVAIFYPFYITPFTSTVFDVMGQRTATTSLRVEYIVMRELAIGCGRAVGILCFLGWIAGWTESAGIHGQVQLFLILLSSLQIGVWWILRSLLRQRARTAPMPSSSSSPLARRRSALAWEISEENETPPTKGAKKKKTEEDHEERV